MLKIKKALKSTLISGLLLSTLSIGTTVYAYDNVTFANNEDFDRTSFNSFGAPSASHENGWGIALDNVDLGNGRTSNVIGCKVTAYIIGDSYRSLIVNEQNSDKRKQLIKDAFARDNFNYASIDVNKQYKSSYFYMYNPNFANYITGGIPYYKSGFFGMHNGTYGWLNKKDSGVEIYGYKLNSVDIQGFETRDEFFNTSIFKVTGDYNSASGWFVGEALSPGARQLAVDITKTNTAFGSGDVVTYIIEPLVAVELENTPGDWFKGVAITPTMAAWASDVYGVGGIGNNTSKDMLSGLGANWFAPYSRFVATDGLMAGETEGVGTLTKDLNTNGLGAYAITVLPSERHTYDTLPEIPSVPVFQKDGETVEYVGMSSTVSKECWNEISEVLSYAMHLTETEPSSNLYNRIQPSVKYVRSKSEDVYQRDGVTYKPDYADAYRSLWNVISRYYYNTTLVSSDNNKITMPRRSGTNQPDSIKSVYGGGAPYVVTPDLGGISGATSGYTTKDYDFMYLGSDNIVDTNATSIGQLGSSSGKDVSIGKVLQDPYAYSIVIDTPNVSSIEGYPEPPNIVVWDENSDSKWEASIDPGLWTQVLNTLRYANGEDGVSNDLNRDSANNARDAKLHKIGIDGNECTIVNSDKYEQYLNEYKNVCSYINDLDSVRTDLGTLINTINDWGNPHAVGSSVDSTWGVYDYDMPGTYICNKLDAYNSWGYNPFRNGYRFKELASKHNGGETFRDIWEHKMDDKYYDKHHRCGNNSEVEILWLDVNNTNQYVASDVHYMDSLVHDRNYTCPWSYEAQLTRQYACAVDMYGWLFSFAQRDAYAEMLAYDTQWALDDAIARKAVLEAFLNEYRETSKTFNTNYDALLGSIPDALENEYLVKSSKNGSAISNDVTDYLSQRNKGMKPESLASQDMLIEWKYRSALFSVASDINGYPNNAKFDSEYNYSGTDFNNGVEHDKVWYTSKKSMAPISGSLKPTLDTAYDKANNKLDFKYRVVCTGDVKTVMTVDNISDYKDASCRTSLTCKEVLKMPYSFGIILNNYDRKTSNNIIHEWQFSKTMEKTALDLKNAWSWTPSNTEKWFNFVPDNDDMIIEDFKPTIATDESSLKWRVTKKSGHNSPFYDYKEGNTSPSGSGLVSRDGTDTLDYSTGTRKGDAIFKLIQLWSVDGGDSGTGTIEVLTAKIEAKSYKASGKTAVVGGNTSLRYDPKSGSSFDIWRDNTADGSDGYLNFRPIFPMTVALSLESNTVNDVLPVVPSSHGMYGLNTDAMLANKYGYLWFTAPHTHKIKSQYEIKVSYKTKAQITSTFSTDNEDLDSMDAILATGDTTPFVKAGQTFEVSASDGNVLVLDGYCNVANPGASVYVEGNGQRFKVPQDFIDYMSGIANELSGCDLAVYSTLNGITTVSNADNAEFRSRYGALETSHTLAGANVDKDTGVMFKDGHTKNTVKEDNTISYGHNVFSPNPSISYSEYGPFTESKLSNDTQKAYNDLINTKCGNEQSWYFEYSEVLQMVHCKVEIKYNDYDFGVTISRYESDFNTSTDAYLNEQFDGINNAWRTMFGYNTSLRKVANDSNAHVICMGVDLTGLDPNGEARKLFISDTGSAVNAILGVQTPIHVRGSVYDNT